MHDVNTLTADVGRLTDSLSHSRDAHIILLFLLEEMGEMTRAYLKENGYKEGNDRVAESFRQEMGDVFMLLLRLAHVTGTDLEHSLAYTMDKLRKGAMPEEL